MRSAGRFALCTVLGAGLSQVLMAAENAFVHGLWVWRSPSVLEAPQGTQKLRDFCRSADINEVYVSVHGDLSTERHLVPLIALLHRSNIRVAALLSSNNADEAGEPREKLLLHVREIAEFNRDHTKTAFDGIHLDIEPQQRQENQGSGNLRFLPDLVDTYRMAQAEASRARLKVNADIPIKILKGSLEQRKMVLTSLPRLTLMFYEVRGTGNDSSTAEKREKLRTASERLLDMAYEGLSGPDLAQLILGLRTPDYGELLPQMLDLLDLTNRHNPHYCGWARHSYNDYLSSAGELRN